MKSLLVVMALVAAVSAQQLQFAATNSRAHNTAQYRDANGKPQARIPILRRNQEFTVTVTGGADKVTLATAKGESTPVTIVKAAGNDLTLKHTQGAIGKFTLTAFKGSAKAGSSEVIFLANPWVAGDETYVKTPVAAADKFPPSIDEHVLNEKGALWRGSSSQNSWVPWAYNQFDMVMLDTTVKLIDNLNLRQRASTALVTRHLTVQSGLVLRGRWDGEYSDGKQPGFWQSSTQIVSQYASSNAVVKYGQCWVFAGLLTALCRTLGIPSRPLTNFDSAHEHQPFDQKCNTYYVKDGGNWKKTKADNSVWNFHVWCDAFMTRPDIAGGKADGWQAIDATPQEESNGPAEAPFNTDDYRCGPASHALLRAMDVKANYDVAFVAGEANCVKIDYVDNNIYSTTKNQIGEMILTKSPDARCSNARVDPATASYGIVCKDNLARSYSIDGSFMEIAARINPQPIVFDLPVDGIQLGKPFKLKVGPGASLLTRGVPINYRIQLTATAYNGKWSADKILKSATGSDAKGLTLAVTRDDWATVFKGIVPQRTMTFEVTVSAEAGKKTLFFKSQMLTVQGPRLSMLCGDKSRHSRNGKIACNVVFSNPLPYAVTNAKMTFTVSGQGQRAEEQSQQEQNAKPPVSVPGVPLAVAGSGPAVVSTSNRAVFKGSFALNGATGPQFILARLTTTELDDIVGSMQINIEP